MIELELLYILLHICADYKYKHQHQLINTTIIVTKPFAFLIVAGRRYSSIYNTPRYIYLDATPSATHQQDCVSSSRREQ